VTTTTVHCSKTQILILIIIPYHNLHFSAYIHLISHMPVHLLSPVTTCTLFSPDSKPSFSTNPFYYIHCVSKNAPTL